jgi:hypothetical protein
LRRTYRAVVVEEGFGKGHTPAEWIGERVTGRTETGDEFVGILAGVTEHGVVIEERRRPGSGPGGSENSGPGYYGWRDILWMYPNR